MAVTVPTGHGGALLGPSTGDSALDDAARAIAIDLFLTPGGARSVAVHGMAAMGSRLDCSVTTDSVNALLDTLLQPEARRCELALFVYERPTLQGRELAFVVSPWRHVPWAITLTSDALVRFRRRRTLEALAGLMTLTESEEQAFRVADVGSLRGDVCLSHFRGDALLTFYYDPSYIALFVAEHLVDCLATFDCFRDAHMLLTRITTEASRRFAAAAAAYGDDEGDGGDVRARRLGQLAVTFQRYGTDLARLRASIAALVDAATTEKRRIRRRIGKAWRAAHGLDSV